MGADGSRSPTNLQHVHATVRWLSPFYGGLRGRFPCFAPMRLPFTSKIVEHSRYLLLTAAQIISRFAHRGSVESERVLRLLWDLNRRFPLCGASELMLVQSGHSTKQMPLSFQKLNGLGFQKLFGFGSRGSFGSFLL